MRRHCMPLHAACSCTICRLRILDAWRSASATKAEPGRTFPFDDARIQARASHELSQGLLHHSPRAAGKAFTQKVAADREKHAVDSVRLRLLTTWLRLTCPALSAL